MKFRVLLTSTFALAGFAFAAEDDNPIKQAVQFAHKAPKGEKKLNEKIAEGTASEADIKKDSERGVWEPHHFGFQDPLGPGTDAGGGNEAILLDPGGGAPLPLFF